MNKAEGAPRSIRLADALREIGGGFGDVGLLVPLAVALITRNHLNATAVFAGAGLFYIASALFFRLPVPVQPLKAVSAIAIASGLGPPGIVAAGLEIGALFVLLSATGLARWLQGLFTRPIIRGIQLSIGLLLAKAAIGLWVTTDQARAQAGFASIGQLAPTLIGVAALLLLVVIARSALPGGSLILLGVGTLAGVILGPHPPTGIGIGPQPLSILIPTPDAFLAGFWLLALPQVGLSIGNSLMATSSAAETYFGAEGKRRVTPTRLALSMGLANLVVSPLSGMPMCHGAGGMTAHFRMGARTWRATAFYGFVLVVVGLGFGTSIAALASVLPLTILGAFLLYVGIEHAALISDLRARGDFLVCGTVAALSIGTGNISAGVVVGLLLSWLLHRRAFRAVPEDNDG